MKTLIIYILLLAYSIAQGQDVYVTPEQMDDTIIFLFKRDTICDTTQIIMVVCDTSIQKNEGVITWVRGYRIESWVNQDDYAHGQHSIENRYTKYLDYNKEPFDKIVLMEYNVK